jgi:hypothetical protein
VELPQLSCNRCGACCLRGGPCVVRKFGGLPVDFEGRCEVLVDMPDGTTNCPLLGAAFNSEGPAKIWASLYVNGECDFQDIRKEICGTVQA